MDRPSFWIDKDSALALKPKDLDRYDKYKAKNVRIGLHGDDSKSVRLIVKATDLSVGYSTPLFANKNFELRDNDKLEIRGRNGTGKSTLVKVLLGEPDPQVFAGEVTRELNIRIGIYWQEVPSNYFKLPLKNAIEQIYLNQDINITETKVRQLLSDYLFNEDDYKTLVADLSGGQKARLQIIAMLANDPQLLVLDEPTSHLDLPSIEELETALLHFRGAILYISHDNYFRHKLGGRVVEL
ncbi:ATP-binding cassette domain-containing protein [Candidatus Saccharibacteria bacterium]|nr:ATP-binding cassette domain-containing protein [Candidatus Saccharibacteria bacterium]